MGTFSCRKRSGPPNPQYAFPVVRVSGDESVNIVRLGIKKRGRCEQSVLGFQGPTERKLALGAENVTSASVILNVMINIIGFCMKITSETLELKLLHFI